MLPVTFFGIVLRPVTLPLFLTSSSLYTDARHSKMKAEVIGERSFQDSLEKCNETWFVLFHVPSCSRCQAFLPVWDQLAYQLRGEIRSATIFVKMVV
jgi:hypothetical protein